MAKSNIVRLSLHDIEIKKGGLFTDSKVILDDGYATFTLYELKKVLIGYLRNIGSKDKVFIGAVCGWPACYNPDELYIVNVGCKTFTVEDMAKIISALL